MFYYRLVAPWPEQIYEVLEPIYADFRRIKFRETSGQFTTVHIDEVVDKLLRDEHFCEVMLPRIPKRWVLEEASKLKKGRASALEQDLNDS